MFLERNAVTKSFLALAIAASALGAQTAQPAFEVASVKVADRNIIPGVSGRMTGGPGTSDPGRITCNQMRLFDLMMKAWDIDGSRIMGPAWLLEQNADVFNLTAVMPPHTTKQQFQLMFQNLLIERFKLKLHHENRTFPGYELTAAPGGAKLTPSANPDAPNPTTGPSGKSDDHGFLILPPGHGAGVRMVNGVHASFQNYTLAELVSGPYLKSFIQQTTGEDSVQVIDRTGLTGKYDFRLKFDARAQAAVVAPRVDAGSNAPDPAAANDPTGLPNLFRALESQLGLKLVKLKGVALDAIIIDHAERLPVE